ncbi:MAG: hypothetical protein RSF40_08275 [Oscillospiraceae bacterium]
MKKFFTSINFKLVPYIILIIYCLFPFENIVKFFFRCVAITLLYVLLCVADSKIVKKYIFTNNKVVIALNILLLISAFLFIDQVDLLMWACIVSVIMVLQVLILIFKKAITLKYFIRSVLEFLLGIHIVTIWWKICDIIPFSSSDIIFDGMEILIISACIIFYFWFCPNHFKTCTDRR